MSKAWKPEATIYTLSHVSSGYWYLGSSAHMATRQKQHQRQLAKGRHLSTTLQMMHDLDGGFHDFRFDIVGKCYLHEQYWVETQLLRTVVGIDGMCVNKYRGASRGVSGQRFTNPEHGVKKSEALVGCNLRKHPTPRPHRVSLISPTGERYDNITNVNAFAKRFRLHQGMLTQVLYGSQSHTKGWRVPEDWQI